jgi:plasmid maintenance system antidote protein VapI
MPQGICPFPPGYIAPAPAHPGAVLRERFIEPFRLTSNQVTKAIGVLPDGVLRRRLFAKMAHRFGR